MTNDPMKLISAVAAGDASRQDVVKALSDQGIDSLDLLVEVLVAATSDRAKPVPLSMLDSRRASRESVESVHRIPHLPFLLNGTLYDPADIKRFDGQELHLIGGSGSEPIVATDDRELFDRWSQFSFLSADRPAKTLDQYGSGGVSTSSGGGGGGGLGGAGLGDGPIGPHPVPGFSGPPRAIFFEDIDYGGNDIECPKDRGFYNLSEIGFTWLGTGDWNDAISSFVPTVPLWTRLWEHVHWVGSSYTVFGGSLNLAAVGWNDHASSTETW